MKNIKKTTIIGIVISIACVIVIRKKIDLKLLRNSFLDLNPYWIITMVATYLSTFILRGLRWRYMLLPIKKDVKIKNTIEGVIVGYMGNSILPARMGEFARAIFLGNRESISKSSVLGTIIIERVFDGLVIVCLFILSSLFLKSFHIKDSRIIMYLIELGGLVFGTAVIVIIAGALCNNSIRKCLRPFISRLPLPISGKVSSILDNGLEALNFLRNVSNLPAVIICSILIWLMEGLVFRIGLSAFNLHEGLFTAYFTLALVNLFLMIPSVPGGIGTFQAGNILALSFFGINREFALSYSIVIHAVMMLPITLIGLYIVNRRDVSIWKMGYY